MSAAGSSRIAPARRHSTAPTPRPVSQTPSLLASLSYGPPYACRLCRSAPARRRSGGRTPRHDSRMPGASCRRSARRWLPPGCVCSCLCCPIVLLVLFWVHGAAGWFVWQGAEAAGCMWSRQLAACRGGGGGAAPGEGPRFRCCAFLLTSCCASRWCALPARRSRLSRRWRSGGTWRLGITMCWSCCRRRAAASPACRWAPSSVLSSGKVEQFRFG